MMERFWHWLMRSNARGVCSAALVALAATCAWWVWREMAPETSEPTVSGAGPREQPVRPIGLLAMLGGDSPLTTADLPRNPFTFPPLPERERRPRPDATTKPTTPSTKPAPSPEPKPRPKPEPRPAPEPTPDITTTAATAEPAPPPPPPPVTLTYRGVFRRTDDRSLALVEDSESGRRRFYGVGESAFDLTFGVSDANTVTVIMADGEEARLPIGEPMLFQGGRHAE